MPDQPNLKFPDMTSNLSPYFRSLICCHCLSEEREDRVLDNNGLLDFDFISRNLPESDGPESDSPEYFAECARILAPMLNSVENWAVVQGDTFVLDSVCKWIAWTGQQKMLADLLAMLCTNDAVSDLAVLLTSTAILERSLGDVYLISGPPPCPSMLKDLLVSKPLIDVLGQNVIQVLRLVIGPPISLNIRNVVWHGFPLPSEIPRRCIWFIILLIPSIGHVLHNRGINVSKHRGPVVFPDVSLVDEEEDMLCDDTIKILCTSHLVNWNTKPFWEFIKKFYTNRCSICAALLCYYLEQGLRRVFAVVNNCEHRILTAESSSLFTTFDEILNPFIPGDEQLENKLRHVLGDPMMEILLDHLMYQDGPRLRDRLSHGEVNWFSFPRQLTLNLITICVSLTISFIPSQLYQQNSPLDRLKTNIQTYRAQFHRISIIKKLLYSLYKHTADVDSIIFLNADLTEREASIIYHTEDSTHFEDSVINVCKQIASNWIHGASCEDQNQVVLSMPYRSNKECCSFMDEILKQKIPTLYRDARPMDESQAIQIDGESEILSLLNHVTTECLTTLTQMHEFASLRQQQFTDKQLRSRQRENLKKFLSSFPSYITAMKFYGYLVTWQFYHLDDLKSLSSKDINLKIRNWKGVLQCCENIRTYTNTEKNKWTEGLKLINKNILLFLSKDNKFFKT